MNSEVIALARKFSDHLCEGVSAAHQELMSEAVSQSISLIAGEMPDLTKVGINVKNLARHPLFTLFPQEKAEDIVARLAADERMRYACHPPDGKSDLYLWTLWAISLLALRPGHSSLQPHQKSVDQP